MTDKAVITCALTGVLTDPKQHPVPVTPEEMAREAKGAFDAGASVMHVHFRRQEPDKGHMPSWEPRVATAIMGAIRDACPGVILNQSTGTMGPDITGPLACLEAVHPEIAACNAGSLNYLKVKSDGSWAWPPRLFDNPVDKIKAYLDVMAKTATKPEFECFDTGIVRCVEMYVRNGMYHGRPQYNFVMGVESGMPADPALLPILQTLIIDGCGWQVTAIGRANIWALHARAAELGGHLRTGLEDTFYLPDGRKARCNSELVEALTKNARDAGRDVASTAEARHIMGLREGASQPAVMNR
jgi:3-keto-5-aminohexanoate cleavage enzyme